MAALLIYASPKRWQNTQHTLITKTALPHVAEGYRLNIWLSSVLISLLKCVKRKQQLWTPQISVLWDHTSELWCIFVWNSFSLCFSLYDFCSVCKFSFGELSASSMCFFSLACCSDSSCWLEQILSHTHRLTHSRSIFCLAPHLCSLTDVLPIRVKEMLTFEELPAEPIYIGLYSL